MYVFGRQKLPKLIATTFTASEEVTCDLPERLDVRDVQVHELRNDRGGVAYEFRRGDQCVELNWMKLDSGHDWMIGLIGQTPKVDFPLFTELYDAVIDSGAREDGNEMDRLRTMAAGRKPPRRERRY